MKRRILALLLAVIMVLGLLPGAAAAEQQQTTVIYGDESAAHNDLMLQGDAPDLEVTDGNVYVSTEAALAAAIARDDVTDIIVADNLQLTAAYTVTDKDVRIGSGVSLTANENGSLTMVKTQTVGTGKGDFVQLVDSQSDLKATKPDFVTLAQDELFYLWVETPIDVDETIDLDSGSCIILIGEAKLNLAAGTYFQSSWVYTESTYYYTYAPVYVTMADEAEENYRCYFFSSWEDALNEMNVWLEEGWHTRYVMADLGENGVLTLTEDFYCSNLILGPDTKLVVEDCRVEVGELEISNHNCGNHRDANYVEVLGTGALKVHGWTIVEGHVYRDPSAALDLNYDNLAITGCFPHLEARDVEWFEDEDGGHWEPADNSNSYFGIEMTPNTYPSYEFVAIYPDASAEGGWAKASLTPTVSGGDSAATATPRLQTEAFCVTELLTPNWDQAYTLSYQAGEYDLTMDLRSVRPEFGIYSSSTPSNGTYLNEFFLTEDGPDTFYAIVDFRDEEDSRTVEGIGLGYWEWDEENEEHFVETKNERMDCLEAEYLGNNAAKITVNRDRIRELGGETEAIPFNLYAEVRDPADPEDPDAHRNLHPFGHHNAVANLLDRLTFHWLSEDEDGHWEEPDDQYGFSMPGNSSRDMVFFVKSWTQNGQQVYEPVEIKTNNPDVTITSLPARKDQENGDYFVRVTDVSENGLWGETVRITPKNADKPYMDFLIGYSKSGIFTAPEMSPAYYVDWYGWSPSRSVLYACVDLDEGEEVTDFCVGEEDTDYASIAATETAGIYKITLTDSLPEEFGLDVCLTIRNSNGDEWDECTYCHIGYYTGGEALVGFEINEAYYTLDSNGAWGKGFHTDEGYVWTETTLPAGVSYDPETNTLTLDNAELTYLGIAYHDGNPNSAARLPNPNLTVHLVDESSIENSDGWNPMDLYDGVNVTFTGSGKLTINGKLNQNEDGNYHGNGLGVDNASLTLDGPTLEVVCNSDMPFDEGHYNGIMLNNAELEVESGNLVIRQKGWNGIQVGGYDGEQNKSYPSTMTVSGGLVQIIFSGDSFGGSGIYVEKDSELHILGGRVDIDSTEVTCKMNGDDYFRYEDGNEAHAHVNSICTSGGYIYISEADIHLDMAKHGNGIVVNVLEHYGEILGEGELEITGRHAEFDEATGAYKFGTHIIVTGTEDCNGIRTESGTVVNMMGGNVYLHTPQGGDICGSFNLSGGLVSSIFPNEVESGSWSWNWGDITVAQDWRESSGGMTVSDTGRLQVNSLEIRDGRTLNVTGGRIVAMPHRDPDPENPEDDGYDEGLSIRDNAAVSISGEGKLYVNMRNMTEGSWGHGVSIGDNGLLKLQGGELKVIDIMRGEAVYVERGSNLNITGGALTINSVAPAALPGPDQVDYNVAGIHVVDSYLRMQGGTIDIDLGWRGTALHVGGGAYMDEEGNYFPGIGNLIQSGGTIDICFNHPSESSDAFADWIDEEGWGWEGFYVESGSTMTLRGGSMNVDNQRSMVFGTLNLYDGAELTVTKGDWMGYGWQTLLVDWDNEMEKPGALNIYGGSLTASAVDANCAMAVLANYVQTGGIVTVDNVMTGNWTWEDDQGNTGAAEQAAFITDLLGTVTVSGGTLNINQTPITGDGHYACGINTMDTFRLQGGTVNAYGDQVGVNISKYYIGEETLNKIIEKHGQAMADRLQAIQPCMYLTGGKLNAACDAENGLTGIYVFTEDEGLKVTGGEHTVQGGMIGLYVTDASEKGSGSASFTGGYTTITGYRCAVVNEQYAYESGLTPDAKVTWGGKVHATAMMDGVKTELTSMPFEEQDLEEDGLYCYSFGFTVDGDAASEGLKEVVFGPEEGVVPELKEDVSATIQILNASSFVGTKSSIRVDAAGSGIVTIYLSEGLRLVEGSVSINGVETDDETLSYLVEGGASIVFSVVPMQEGDHSIEVTTSSGEGAETVLLTAYDFDISMPASTFVTRSVKEGEDIGDTTNYKTAVTVTGNTAAEQKVTLKLVKRTVNNPEGVVTVLSKDYETTANALGGLIQELEMPLNDDDADYMTYSQTFDFEVYLGEDDKTVIKELQTTWYPTGGSLPNPNPKPDDPEPDPEPVSPIVLPNIIIKNDVHDQYNIKVKRITKLDPGIYNHFFVYWPGENFFCFEVHPILAPGVEIEELNVSIRFSNDPNEIPTTLELERKQDEETDDIPLVYRVCEELPSPPKYLRFEYKLDIPGFTKPVPGETPWYKLIPIIDPSGVIYEGTEDNPVAGAEVSLYFGGDNKGAIDTTAYDKGEIYTDITTVFGQANPQITNETGSYHWDVPEGWWLVEAKYNGKTVTSQWMWVGSPRTDVHLNLNLDETPVDVTKVYVTDAGGIPDDPNQAFNVTVKVANYDMEHDMQVQVAVAAYTADDQFIGLYTNPAFKTTLEKSGTMLVPIVVQPNGKVVDKLKAFIVNPDGSWTPIGAAGMLSKPKNS